MYNEFTDTRKPSYMSIDWTMAKTDTAISFQKLTKVQISKIINKAKRYGVIVEEDTTDNETTFYVNKGYEKSTDNTQILLAAIRMIDGGISWADMQRTLPFTHLKPRDLKENISKLLQDGLISEEEKRTGGRGRPTMLYKAILK